MRKPNRSQAWGKEVKMFKRILVAYDGSPESKRALLTGIYLAKSLNAELRAVSVLENLPAYAGYIDAGLPGETAELREQGSEHYRKIQVEAQLTARHEGIVLMTELIEGDEVQAIVECVQRTRSDLLVLGIHQHSWLFSRLLNHTTHDLSQQVASSILEVH
jgi:nucleotide-binding universal stress UspA family protein